MADLFIFIMILSSMALAADIVERVLTYKKEKKEANNERMVTIDYEYSEEDIMKANEIYEKIMAAMIKQDLESYIEAEEALKGVDNMDFVELNGEKVVYNEDDQE